MNKDKKVIPIDETLHTEFKQYCKSNGYVIKSLVEKLIRDELSKNIQPNSRESKARN